MRLEERRKEIAGSALVFTVFFATLTALRVWDLEPATSVQSAIVNGTALLVIAAVAYYEYSGGDFFNGWILALGPSLAFTLNLFLSGPTAKVLPLIGYAIASAIAISGVIAVIGYLLGEGLTRATGARVAGRLS